MAFDFKKEYKEFYMPKARPEIVTVPKMNYNIKHGYEPTEYNMIETENGDYLCFDVMEKSI